MKYYQVSRSFAGALGAGAKSLDGFSFNPNRDFTIRKIKAEAYIFSAAGIVTLPCVGNILVPANSIVINQEPTADISLGTSSFNGNILSWLFDSSSKMEDIDVPIIVGSNWFLRGTTWSPAILAGETLVIYMTMGYELREQVVKLD